jgi:hypothetical protein
VISIKFDTRKVEVALDRMTEIPAKAGARAINRTMTSTRAVLARDIAADLGLKVSTVKDQLRLMNARPDSLTGRITVSGKPIPLIEFKAKWSRRSGVRTNLQPPAKGRYPDAFIATVGRGHTGVFKRVPGGKRRGPKPHRSQLPIYELHGPSLPAVFGKMTPKALAHAEAELQKNLAHETAFALKQAAQ